MADYNVNNITTKDIKSQSFSVISSHNITQNNQNNIQNLSFHFTNEKAGMKGLDREEIDKIIFETTKDSAITKKKMEEFERIKLIVEDYKIKLDSLKKNEILYEQNRRLAKSRIKEFKKERNVERIWMHIDMDMFYAAVEIRDKPELTDKPVAVGDERMVSTSNYIARKYGVRSAMPGFIAKRLCEKLIFVKPNFYKYETESKKIMGILKHYDSDIDVRGLDEAYLDLTNYCKLNYITTHQEITDLINEIKKKILEHTKLTASCGIACNKMLAKICSDMYKPNGLYIQSNNINDIESFMRNLKVRKIPSVGEKLEKKLNLMGIYTCEDIINRQVDIFHLFSENQFDFLLCSSFGFGSCYHEEVREAISKSISCSETFRVTSDIEFIIKQFHSLCKKLYLNMIEQSVTGKTLTVETTDKNEKHLAKSLSIIKRFETESEIINNGWNLLKPMIEGNAVRMIRIKISSLQQVNPETLKKKEENKIKHWINRLNDNNGEIGVKTRSKSMKTGSIIQNESLKEKNIMDVDVIDINNYSKQSENIVEIKNSLHASVKKIPQPSKSKSPNLQDKYFTIDQLFFKMKVEKEKNSGKPKISNKIPASPDTSKSNFANQKNLKRKSKNTATSTSIKKKRNKKNQDVGKLDKGPMGPLDKFVINSNNNKL
jgi:DNA polymerase kappa